MAQSTTYRRVHAVKKSLEIMAFLGDQKTPVSGDKIAEQIGMNYATTMCHLATLMDFDFVKQEGDGYALGMMLAVFWSRKKAQLEAQRDLINCRLKELEVSDV